MAVETPGLGAREGGEEEGGEEGCQLHLDGGWRGAALDGWSTVCWMEITYLYQNVKIPNHPYDYLTRCSLRLIKLHHEPPAHERVIS